jgi:hypothetical protein
VWDSSCQSALDRPARAGCYGKIRKLVVATRPRHLWQDQRGDDSCGRCSPANDLSRPPARNSCRLVLDDHSGDNGFPYAQRLGNQLRALNTRDKMSFELGRSVAIQLTINVGSQ